MKNSSIQKTPAIGNHRSKDTRCGFCGCGSSVALYPTTDLHGQGYTLRRCGQCEFAFLAPRPTAEELTRAYDDSYYGTSDAKFGSFIESILDYFRKTATDGYNGISQRPALSLISAAAMVDFSAISLRKDITHTVLNGPVSLPNAPPGLNICICQRNPLKKTRTHSIFLMRSPCGMSLSTWTNPKQPWK